MYEALEGCAADFNDLPTKLADPARIATIRAALEASAKRISETAGETQMDRDNLSKLYRGMLAASRIVALLHERRGDA